MRRRQHRRTTIDALEPRLLLAVTPVPRPTFNTGTGFFVSSGRIYDANGYEFVMKGPNQTHAWGSYNTNYNTIDQIAKTGANATRAVMYQDIVADPTNNWTDAADTPTRRRQVVERYLANGIVPVVEDHASIQDSSSQSNTAALQEIVTHWLDNTSWLKQYESAIILNIANEWGPPANASGSNTVWRDSYITQVNRLRAGVDGNLATQADNINCLIMIDAGQWGQDLNTLRLHAQQVLDADPQHNVVFSIHLYGQWRADDRPWEVNGAANSDFGPWDVRSRLTALRNANLPLVVGEFAWEDFRDFSNLGAPYGAYRTRNVLEICNQLGIGWLGWSWNQSSPLTLNMVAGSLSNYQYNSNTDLTDWGNALVNDPDVGLKASAARATIFPMAGLPNPSGGLPALPSNPPPELRLVLQDTFNTVAEGGQGAARVRLNRQPVSNVTVNIAKITGGTNDVDLSLATSTLTFTPQNWDKYQAILLNGAVDADASAGTAKFQLTASNVLSADFLAREVEPPTGSSLTINPDRDRLYNGSGTAASVSVNSTFPPNGAPNNTLFMRFNLGSLLGKISSAVLRVFTTNVTTNLRVRVFGTVSDAWTESETAGINASYPIPAASAGTLLPTSGAAYVDITSAELTQWVRSQHFKDGIVSLAIRMVSGSATFQTREGANPPQLVLTTVEAIPPQVTAASFDYTTNPNKLTFTFTENVAPSLAVSDVVLESISNPGATLTLLAPTYDAGTNTVTYVISPGIVPDGTYRATLIGAGVTDAAANAVLTDTLLDFFALAGDANHDKSVDLTDFTILASNFNGTGRTYGQADFNYDTVVDLTDFTILAANFNRALPAPDEPDAPPARLAPAPPSRTALWFTNGRDDDAAGDVISGVPI